MISLTTVVVVGCVIVIICVITIAVILITDKRECLIEELGEEKKNGRE